MLLKHDEAGKEFSLKGNEEKTKIMTYEKKDANQTKRDNKQLQLRINQQENKLKNI